MIFENQHINLKMETYCLVQYWEGYFNPLAAILSWTFIGICNYISVKIMYFWYIDVYVLKLPDVKA